MWSTSLIDISIDSYILEKTAEQYEHMEYFMESERTEMQSRILPTIDDGSDGIGDATSQ